MLSSLRAIVRDLAPQLLSAEDAAAAVADFAEIERLAHAGKTLAAGRVAEGGSWRDAGEHSPAEWLAKTTGSTVGASREALRTAAKVQAAPRTEAALRAGKLSAAQAAAIAPAAAADPGSEQRLLEMAEYQSLQKLRDECARVEAAADPDPKGRHERVRKNRFWRRWTRPDGSRAGMYAGTPEEVARFESHVQPFVDARIDAARRTGDAEPSEAIAFDGLMDAAEAARRRVESRDTDDEVDETVAEDLVVEAADDAADDMTSSSERPSLQHVREARGGRGRKRLSERRELLVILNLNPPFGDGGPTCEIPGFGPVPLSIIDRWFVDALVRIVIRDGVDVRTVVHAGRIANLAQETAVLALQLGRCGKPRCGLPISEIDHRIDYAVTRTTTLDDLLGLCGRCHDLKTRHGHTWRREPDGTITWIRPDGVEEHERPPPPS